MIPKEINQKHQDHLLNWLAHKTPNGNLRKAGSFTGVIGSILIFQMSPVIETRRK